MLVILAVRNVQEADPQIVKAAYQVNLLFKTKKKGNFHFQKIIFSTEELATTRDVLLELMETTLH